MPKLLENMRLQLLLQTKKQLAERGYGKTTVRSIAEACGVAVGTVYNYFPSKEAMVAAFMSEDWTACKERFLRDLPAAPEDALRRLYDMLRTFADEHRVLFSDPDAGKPFFAAFSTRHGQLRDQIADVLLPFCTGDGRVFLSRFVAEALLSWTMAGTPFEKLYAVIGKLI